MHRVAVIGGDGIGPEVTDRGAARHRGSRRRALDTVHLPSGWAAVPGTTARSSSDETVEELRGFDAILLGAVGHPDVPPGLIERGPAAEGAVRARPLREPAALRRSRRAQCVMPAHTFTVIRENTEGTYAGEGGFLRKGTPHEDGDTGLR